MRRIQVLLDESTYELLRGRAFERGLPISALVREVLAEHFSTARSQPRLDYLTFLGAGSSVQGASGPISERHDEALAEAFHYDLSREGYQAYGP